MTCVFCSSSGGSGSGRKAWGWGSKNSGSGNSGSEGSTSGAARRWMGRSGAPILAIRSATLTPPPAWLPVCSVSSMSCGAAGSTAVSGCQRWMLSSGGGSKNRSQERRPGWATGPSGSVGREPRPVRADRYEWRRARRHSCPTGLRSSDADVSVSVRGGSAAPLVSARRLVPSVFVAPVRRHKIIRRPSACNKAHIVLSYRSGSDFDPVDSAAGVHDVGAGRHRAVVGVVQPAFREHDPGG